MGEDLIHVLEILTLEVQSQTAQQGCLPRRQPPAVLVVPVRHPDTAAIPTADRLDGVVKCERFDVPANSPLTHP